MGSRAQAAAISAPEPGQRDRGLGGQHAGDSGRAELTDAVAGDHADLVEGELLGGEQGGGDQQGLGQRGVLDLLRVRLGAEVDQVDPGEGRPPGEPRRGAGQVEPWGEEAGLLGTLAGSGKDQHIVNLAL